MVEVKLNPDANIVKEIRDRIKANNGHCACSIIPTDDNKCICKEFREQIDRGEAGMCHCGLYKIIVKEV